MLFGLLYIAKNYVLKMKLRKININFLDDQITLLIKYLVIVDSLNSQNYDPLTFYPKNKQLTSIEKKKIYFFL